MKFQGQREARQTNHFSKPNKGATLHSRTTGADNHFQENVKSVHQGQMHSGKTGSYQGQPSSKTTDGMAKRSKSGAVTHTTGSAPRSNSGGMAY